MQRKTPKYLEDIREAIEFLLDLTQGRRRKEFGSAVRPAVAERQRLQPRSRGFLAVAQPL